MIDHYRRMIDDPVRVHAFGCAIEAAVRKGDVVVDLGCALGNYAVYACRAGAARVYALDARPIVSVAREVAAANDCQDAIHFLHGHSTDLDVPERADVVIFEDYPTTLVSPRATRTTRDVVARWLGPGGRLVPARARLWAAAVEAGSEYREIDRFASAGEKAGSVDIAPTRRLALSEVAAVHLEEGALLTHPEPVAQVDLMPMGDPSVDLSVRSTARRDGILHGLLLWFELELADAWLGTGPLSPKVAWKQALFPLDMPLPAKQDDSLELSLRGGPFGDEMVWQWRVETPSGACESSTLNSMALEAERLARWDAAAAPPLDREHQFDLAVLQLLDGSRSLGEIAERLAGDFDGRFDTTEDLKRRILEVVRREQGRSG